MLSWEYSKKVTFFLLICKAESLHGHSSRREFSWFNGWQINLFDRLPVLVLGLRVDDMVAYYEMVTNSNHQDRDYMHATFKEMRCCYTLRTRVEKNEVQCKLDMIINWVSMAFYGVTSRRMLYYKVLIVAKHDCLMHSNWDVHNYVAKTFRIKKFSRIRCIESWQELSLCQKISRERDTMERSHNIKK